MVRKLIILCLFCLSCLTVEHYLIETKSIRETLEELKLESWVLAKEASRANRNIHVSDNENAVGVMQQFYYGQRVKQKRRV